MHVEGTKVQPKAHVAQLVFSYYFEKSFHTVR